MSEIISYILKSEKLIIISLAIVLAGVALHLGEQSAFFQFDEMPRWSRQTATVIWVLAAAHIVVRFAIALPSLAKAAFQQVFNIPVRVRQYTADRPVINRLRSASGFPREVLSYARFRGENHIWTDGSDNIRWLNSLKEAGLVELYDAGFRSAHYRIHPTAWSYMIAHPNQFMHVLGWRNPPWTHNVNEDQIERRIQES